MIEVKGKFNKAKVFTEVVDSATLDQVKAFTDSEYLSGQQIRIMPDCHAGKGVCIGFTSTFKDKINPSTVGCDIGCGMLVVELGKIEIDFEKLDEIVRSKVPYGCGAINDHYALADMDKDIAEQERKELQSIIAPNKVERNLYSIGSLGSGNHFIEIDSDEDGYKYLVIHTGSRGLGIEVEKYYSEKAAKAQHKEVYIEGQDFEDYLHDMAIAQRFADLNRKLIAHKICKGMEWQPQDEWTTIHNYIDIEHKIIRKGAISCEDYELVIIPINMRDGSLICRGKGNPDWNCSGPHGAGRIMSRAEAKKKLSVKEFKESMEGIWTSCVGQGTLDESPMAYKTMDDIVENIKPTADIVKVIKPIYNFKAN